MALGTGAPGEGTFAGIFNTTHWSAVLSAGQGDSPETDAAFGELCRTYRPALFAFLRSQGHSPADADDFVQGFLAKLVENREQKLRTLDPAKGKFRSFLLVSLKRFLGDEHEKAAAEKRGGRAEIISLDAPSPEGCFREPADLLSPDRQYDRSWAQALLAEALKALEQEMLAAGQGLTYGALVEFLKVKMPGQSHADVARRLGTTTGTVRNAVQRLRERYGELIRMEIARTLASPTRTAVDEELGCLLEALG